MKLMQPPPTGAETLVFSGFDVGDEILPVAGRLPAHSQRSLCELPLGPEDRTWLREWADTLSAQRALGLLEATHLHCHYQSTGRDAFGLIFPLLIPTWSAARAARALSGHGFLTDSQKVAGVLFAQGQPSIQLKIALEAASERFGLDNASGQEGTQAYYNSAVLQFGFTRLSGV